MLMAQFGIVIVQNFICAHGGWSTIHYLWTGDQLLVSSEI